MNFRLLLNEATKLGPQRIMVKSPHASWPPLSAESSVGAKHSGEFINLNFKISDAAVTSIVGFDSNGL